MQSTLLSYLLSDDAKKALHIAAQYAKENIHPTYGAAHLLKALLHKDVGLLPLSKSLGKDQYFIEEWADVRLEEYAKAAPNGEPVGDDSVAALLNEADDVRFKLNNDQIDALAILISIVSPGVVFSFDQLKSFPLKRDELISANIDNQAINEMLGAAGINTTNADEKKHGSALQKYCINKSEKAKQGKLDEIVGRNNELRMMAEILCRRSKPNVILTGEPGVGKSAMVDGFAMLIEEKQVPEMLQAAQIFELDNGALVAGASYKGEVEDRLKSIIVELKKLDKAILFIDELHALLDKNGAANGAANILKPELARGEITIVGATTLEEYKKHIENDDAFSRRFEVIKLDEPDETVAFQMLKKVLPYYQAHHAIEVDEVVMKESIRLAKRYIKDRRLPDAAIDLMDRTMASLRMLNETGIKDVDALAITVKEWKAIKEKDKIKSMEEWQWLCRSFKTKISPILVGQISSEVEPEKIEKKEELVNYLETLVKDIQKLAKEPRAHLIKTDVASIVSSKTGIPLGKLQSQEQERLMNMETIIKQRVVGQDYAVKSIADAILESRSGLGKPGQPIGSFFFLGPTGTGKTELAKSLAEFLFQDESFMIRFDMSEFKEEHSAALLYGAPPGYVGYEEGGLLVNKIRRQPYAVVLFDEIEKAHPSVFDVFLQIMDEGKLHDKLGKTGDFSNAVVIFTSNIGSQHIVEKFNQGIVPTSNELIEIMASKFRPEFLGRLTEIVPFAPMKQEIVRGILDIQLKSLYSALDKQGIKLNISKEALDYIAEQGFTPAYGARPLAGVIRTLLRRTLSKKIIAGEIKTGTIIDLKMEQGKLDWVYTHKK